MTESEFTPALGYSALTPFYDGAIRLLTREAVWRGMLLDAIGPRDGEAILDAGCGTGSLAVEIKRRAPRAHVVGLDPDPDALARASAKAAGAGVDIEWRHGFARDCAAFSGEFDQTVSSLVLHQIPLGEKRAGLLGMFKAVRSGGTVHIADYCRQPSVLSRQLFRFIQLLDGFDNTQPNVEGAVERLLAEAAGTPVKPHAVLSTPTGAISLFEAKKPG